MAGQHTHMVSTELTSRHVKKKTTKKGKKEKQQVTPSPTSTQPEDDEQEDRTCATEIVEDVIELTVDRGHGEESEALAVDWPPTPPPPQPIAAPAVNPPPLSRTAFAVSPPPPPPRTARAVQPPLSAPPTSAEAKGVVPGPAIAPELNIVKASSTLPKPKTTPAPAIPPELLEEESDAVQGLKGKVGYIPLKADDPFAYFKPKHQVADKHKMVQCRFPECGISIKDNEVSSLCAFHRNEMAKWYDQKLWKKLEGDANGRTIKRGERRVAKLRPRPTSSTGQCYCR